jgi:hypothetical protein
MATPSKTPDTSYPNGTRSSRFKAPEINPDELTMIDWFRRLSPAERDDLRSQYQQQPEPICPAGLEELVQDWRREMVAQGKARNTARIYTHIGGKARNMHKDKKEQLGGRGTAGKTVLMGMVERGGRVWAKVIPNTDRQTLEKETHSNVVKGSAIFTEGHSGYDHLENGGYILHAGQPSN